ncbi:1607_t:CDS:2, partial [Acaulospora colombiana]
MSLQVSNQEHLYTSTEVKKTDVSSRLGVNEPQKDVNFLQLFRYATLFDWFLITLGSIAALANGASMPVMTIIFSRVIESFAVFTLSISTNGFTEAAKDDLHSSMISNVKLFLILGAARVRQIYYEAILRQDISYFDSISTGDITTRISSDANLFQEGISEKISQVIQSVTTFIAGFVVGFTK